MKRRTSHLAIPTLLIAGSLAWVHAHEQPATAPSGSGGDKVVTKSGLTIITTQKSTGAQKGDTIYVLYSGRLTSGEVFDASELHGNQPISLKLGEQSVIAGWEEGLLGAHVGEKRTLIIPSELAYGAKGRGEKIPPNSTLEFDIVVTGLTRPVEH